MTEIEHGVSWVQLLWDYMVDKASLRSHMIHHDQSGLSHPNHEENGEKNGNIISIT